MTSVAVWLGCVGRGTDQAGLEWFRRALDQVATACEPETFLEAFACVTRRLGQASVDFTPEEAAHLHAIEAEWPLTGWRVDELGRIALLMHAAACSSAQEERLVEACYRCGDTNERHAILSALSLLPHPARYLSLGLEACRSALQPLFEAIACENPFPARYFPEPAFNQLVLKAVWTQVALARIVGLSRRLTPELARMAHDYASERQAAGRAVPAEVWRLTTMEARA